MFVFGHNFGNQKLYFASDMEKVRRELLKCILDIEPKEITILNPEIIGSSYYDKRTIVDLIVELEDGTHKIYATQTVDGIESTKCADRFIIVNKKNICEKYLLSSNKNIEIKYITEK